MFIGERWRGSSATGHIGRSSRTASEGTEVNDARRSPLEACVSIATQKGTTRALASDDASFAVGNAAPEDAVRSRKGRGEAVELEAFNMHASVRVSAEDDFSRERLCRYGARPPFSLERLRQLPGGCLAYRTKDVGRGRAKHRMMTPLEQGMDKVRVQRWQEAATAFEESIKHEEDVAIAPSVRLGLAEAYGI